ncbi:MAG: hypothetical protein Q9193_005608, partial [Seirophora villosa]
MEVQMAKEGTPADIKLSRDVGRKFTSMRTLILDEADRMLDQGFLPAILDVLKALPPKTSAKWQGMCFSATIPPKTQQVFSHVLKPDHAKISTIDSSEPPTLDKVPQFSIVVPSVKDTFTSLFLLLQEEIKATVGEPKIIVFGVTANMVALCAEVFQEAQLGLKVYELHSRLSQAQRTRTTDVFKTAKNGILFASDVVGRGMDFPDVSLVVQLGLPSDADAYTHRVGRTARAGKDGRAVIVLTDAESFYLRKNPQFPIQPYPASTKIRELLDTNLPIKTAVQSADLDSKRKAYSAYLGFMKGFMKNLKLDPAGLVRMANQFALEGMYCHEVPRLEKKTVGKMGLKKVPGLSYVENSTENRDPGPAPQIHQQKLQAVDVTQQPAEICDLNQPESRVARFTLPPRGPVRQDRAALAARFTAAWNRFDDTELQQLIVRRYFEVNPNGRPNMDQVREMVVDILRLIGARIAPREAIILLLQAGLNAALAVQEYIRLRHPRVVAETNEVRNPPSPQERAKDKADKIHAEDDRQPIPDDVDVLEVEWSEEGTTRAVYHYQIRKYLIERDLK